MPTIFLMLPSSRNMICDCAPGRSRFAQDLDPSDLGEERQLVQRFAKDRRGSEAAISSQGRLNHVEFP
jgi:hypothetical protein